MRPRTRSLCIGPTSILQVCDVRLQAIRVFHISRLHARHFLPQLFHRPDVMSGHTVSFPTVVRRRSSVANGRTNADGESGHRESHQQPATPVAFVPCDGRTPAALIRRPIRWSVGRVSRVVVSSSHSQSRGLKGLEDDSEGIRVCMSYEYVDTNGGTSTHRIDRHLCASYARPSPLSIPRTW